MSAPQQPAGEQAPGGIDLRARMFGDRMAIKMLVAAGYVTEAKANEALNIAHGFDKGPLAQAQGGGEVVERVAVALHRAYNTMLDSADFPDGWPGWQGATPEEREFFMRHARVAVTAPPSAPVGVEGFVAWFNNCGVQGRPPSQLARAAWEAALAQHPAAVDDQPDCPHSALDGCDCYASKQGGGRASV